jgi:phosphate:Na+ symporter
MVTFKIIYTVLGGLGIFFYGMKTMSEAFQSMAGDTIKRVINSLTTHRVFAVTVGCLVTMIVQSSSVTTVMVVGLVNAGLMSLVQAIGVIFGANIGTTVTGWIISIKIGKYGLLLIGLGIFPALFAKSTKVKEIGKALFGIGMIFFGLETMSSGFKPLRSMPEFLDAISFFSGQHYGAYLACVAVGCILTMIVQSSSAMLGITISMATTGIIEFHTAAALVLGENIGTTITALLASVGGNINAKRAARAHATFNLLGVLIMILIFPFYIEFIDNLIPGNPNLLNEAGEKPLIAKHIAMSHTVFNVLATIIFLPFLNILAKFVVKITPETEPEQKKPKKLLMLGNVADLRPATALFEAQKEIEKQKSIVERMFGIAKKYLTEEDRSEEAFKKISEYEKITDNIQHEITNFVCNVMEKEMSREQTTEAAAWIKIADELESVADYLEKVVIFGSRFMEKNKFEGELREEFLSFFNKIEDFFNEVVKGIHISETPQTELHTKKSAELRILADSLRSKHIERITKGGYTPDSSLNYSDMVVALRKVRSHSANISEALGERVF